MKTKFFNFLQNFSIVLSGLPPYTLALKTSAIVMLLRNLNATQGLLNGTRFIVRNMHDNCLDLEIITGDRVGQRVLVNRIDLSPSDTHILSNSANFPFVWLFL